MIVDATFLDDRASQTLLIYQRHHHFCVLLVGKSLNKHKENRMHRQRILTSEITLVQQYNLVLDICQLVFDNVLILLYSNANSQI
ncbi:unnamed protein product [Rotaria magnacalcarata]